MARDLEYKTQARSCAAAVAALFEAEDSAMSRFFGALFVFAVLTLTSSGCCPDESYCDATGCYACDGLGCRPIDPPAECQFNSECGAGRVCRNAECVAQCDASNPCPEGQMCSTAGLCVDAPPVMCEEATESVDCEGGNCIDNVCFDTCTMDEECGEGRYCLSGACVIDHRPRPTCTSDSQCEYACVDGVCRTPCESLDDCARRDVQFGFCLNGYCATSNEVTSDCARQADCGSNQDCIDGICTNRR